MTTITKWTRAARGAAVALVAAGAVPTAGAAILRVPDDHTTIQSAVAAAVPGQDEIWVSAAGSPYVLPSTLILVGGVDYRGGWDALFLSQDASRTRIHLAQDSTGSAVDAALLGAGDLFSHFTVGPPVKPATFTTVNGAGMFIGSGSPTIANCVFENNVSRDAGGAIQIAAGSAAYILDCTFDSNETGLVAGGGRGGAISVASGSNGVRIELCRFTGNWSDRASVTLSAAGGALFTRSGIRLERCKFEDNYSGFHGGALFVVDADLRAWGNLFYADSAARHGGAIYHQNGSGEHNGSLIEDCVAGAGTGEIGNGGGIYFERGSNRFLDGYVRRCTATQGNGFSDGVGGAFYFFEPLAGSAVRRTEISGNRAQVGGAVGVQGTTTVTFSDAALEANTIVANYAAIGDAARYGGGGVHIFADFIGEIVDNIIAEQENGAGISCEGLLASPNIRFNCVWNGPSNSDPEYGQDCVDRTNINGNIRSNPLLCCFSGGCVPAGSPPPDLQLSAASPCLGAGEGGVDMGKYGSTNCTTPVSLEPASWGAIKALYR
ncbi:MAG: right-handed parallel beta-helix repeat-containing protein [Candidatus Eiseniibacteriota bacterium]